MRSDILAQELKERRDKKRLERKRRLNRKNQRAWYKRQKLKLEAILGPLHPTLDRENTLAVEEAARIDGVLRPSPQTAIRPAVVIQPAQQPAPSADEEKRPAPDCLAAMREHEERVAPQIKALEVLKYGQPQPEETPRDERPFDLGGIIL